MKNKIFYQLSTLRLQGKYRNTHAFGHNRKHVLRVSKIQYHNVEKFALRFKPITWDSKNAGITVHVISILQFLNTKIQGH